MKKAEQERLTRVGPGTPMGELLRRYWLPIAGDNEIRPGATHPVRLLGEDLVLFRTLDGELGLVTERCRHRGSSLRCGHVDEAGIRCPYHGWRFAPDGACLEIPGEKAPGARLLERARATAYPVAVLGGLVFAYLGPEPRPLLPRYDLFVREGVLRDIGRAVIPCNWLQIMENSVDPLHVEWLHGQHLAGVRAARGLDVPTHYRRRHQRIAFEVFPFGIVKRRIVEGRSEADDDWRTGHPLIFPLMLRVGAGRQHRFQIRVPVDDTHTLHWWYSCYLPEPGQAAPVQPGIPVYDVPWQDEAGNFIVDFVDGGDIMAWVTQGPIADRTRELLVPADRGITLYRRLLREQLRLVAAGQDPMGIVRDPAANQCIAFAQEGEKLGGGTAFLRESIAMSHVRHSPLRDQILSLLGES